jgi:hypothetical protein
MGKKQKKGKARRQHTDPREEEREPRAFVEWKRAVTRKIAAKPAREFSSEEVAQQMYVICFLRDFTTWDDVDIHTLVRYEGLHTMDDIPRLFDFHLTSYWDIPWTQEAAALFEVIAAADEHYGGDLNAVAAEDIIQDNRSSKTGALAQSAPEDIIQDEIAVALGPAPKELEYEIAVAPDLGATEKPKVKLKENAIEAAAAVTGKIFHHVEDLEEAADVVTGTIFHHVEDLEEAADAVTGKIFHHVEDLENTANPTCFARVLARYVPSVSELASN